MVRVSGVVMRRPFWVCVSISAGLAATAYVVSGCVVPSSVKMRMWAGVIMQHTMQCAPARLAALPAVSMKLSPSSKA